MLRSTMKLVTAIVMLLLTCNFGGAHYLQEQDPYNAAIKAYREKNYPVLLENISRVERSTGNNMGILDLLARAFALNNRPDDAIKTLRRIALIGGSINLDSADYASLKSAAALTDLRDQFQKNITPVKNSSLAFTLAERNLIPEGIAY